MGGERFWLYKRTCSIWVRSRPSSSGQKCILFSFYSLWVGVEDAQSETYIPVTVVVSPGMTITQLKDKVLMFQQSQHVT